MPLGALKTVPFLLFTGALVLAPVYAVDISYNTAGVFTGNKDPVYPERIVHSILFTGGIFSVDAPADGTFAQLERLQ